ncbi:uncharacterized protein LOC120588132 [Pteropus medius]|uniref:uncharacterized protein LOC120588132 n=1 Tax=Pteropus vampyrus TaxID=132908 RepID=UPI00196B3DFA|nr:uncharacterized protein LOC120588132 [Pteropus giganteus]
MPAAAGSGRRANQPTPGLGALRPPGRSPQRPGAGSACAPQLCTGEGVCVALAPGLSTGDRRLRKVILLTLPNSGGRRLPGGQPGSCRIHAHSTSHSHIRPHTHSSDCDAGREGSLLPGEPWGLARVRGFPSCWEILRPSGIRGERTPRICSPTRWGMGTVSTPGIFPPLSPQCHPLEGAERQTRGRLLYASWEPALKAGAGWRTDRHRDMY